MGPFEARWTEGELDLLRELWPDPENSREEIEQALAEKSWAAINHKGRRLGLRRGHPNWGGRTGAEVRPRGWRELDHSAAHEDLADKALSGALSRKEADRLAALLADHGYDLRRSAVPSDSRTQEIATDRWDGTTYRFALISCCHYGSIWQQRSNLAAFYNYCAEQGIADVFNAGDLSDGDDSMHKGFLYGLFVHGADQHRDYIVEHYPRHHGIRTYIISGNHDLTFQKQCGYNIVRAVCGRRDDLTYLGDWAADLVLGGGLRVRLRHGRGGPAYAMSYKLQKAVGAMNFRHDPPDVYAIGHWHTSCWLPNVQGVSAFLLGAFQGNTDYCRSHPSLSEPDIGGWIVDYQVDREGKFEPCSIKAEFVPFEEIASDY